MSRRTQTGAMPKKEPITLDGASFTSIKSAQDHVRNLMKEIGVCASVKERDVQYYGRVLAIARRHPKSSKLDGVCDFAIAHNKLSRSALEVIIIKEDGTTEDISLLNKCITCKLDTQKASLASAFRYSIDDQIKAFRKQATATQCELCNCVLSAHSGLVHVDHTVHFEQLVADFLSTYGQPLPTTFVSIATPLRPVTNRYPTHSTTTTRNTRSCGWCAPVATCPGRSGSSSRS